MDFVAVMDQAMTLLRQRGRLTYSTLKRQCQLAEEALGDLTIALIDSQCLVMDEQGTVLVWTGPARILLADKEQRSVIRGSLWPGRSTWNSCHCG